MNDFLTFMGFIFCLVRCVRCQVENIIRIHLDEKTKSSRYPTIATTIYNCSNLEDNNMMYYIRLLTASNLGWKGSFYTLAAMDIKDYIIAENIHKKKIMKNTFQSDGKMEDHAVCLESNNYYSFVITKNLNENIENENYNNEIGAYICGKFISGGDTINFYTLKSGECIPYLIGQSVETTRFGPEGRVRGLYSMSFSLPVEPSFIPTFSPTLSPTFTFVLPEKEQKCLNTCPSYSSTPTLAQSCSFFTSAGCTSYNASISAPHLLLSTVPSVPNFSCVPPCLSSTACGSSYCKQFTKLSLECSSNSNYSYSLPLADNISALCIHKFLQTQGTLTLLNFKVTFLMQNITLLVVNSDSKAKEVMTSAVINSVTGLFQNDLTVTASASSTSTSAGILIKTQVPTLISLAVKILKKEQIKTFSFYQIVSNELNMNDSKLAVKYVDNISIIASHMKSYGMSTSTSAIGGLNKITNTQKNINGELDKKSDYHRKKYNVEQSNFILSSEEVSKEVDISNNTTSLKIVCTVSVALQSMGYKLTSGVNINTTAFAAYNEIIQELSNAVNSGQYTALFRQAVIQYGASHSLLNAYAVSNSVHTSGPYSTTSADGIQSKPESSLQAFENLFIPSMKASFITTVIIVILIGLVCCVFPYILWIYCKPHSKASYVGNSDKEDKLMKDTAIQIPYKDGGIGLKIIQIVKKGKKRSISPRNYIKVPPILHPNSIQPARLPYRF